MSSQSRFGDFATQLHVANAVTGSHGYQDQEHTEGADLHVLHQLGWTIDAMNGALVPECDLYTVGYRWRILDDGFIEICVLYVFSVAMRCNYKSLPDKARV